MKNLMITLLTIAMVVSISFQSVMAQTTDNQLYLMRTMKVEPSKRAAFEKALKTANAAFKEAKVSNLEYYTYSTTNYDYYAAIPIENMAALDKSAWGEAISKMGREKFIAAVTPVEENWGETNMDIYLHRKDWTYQHASLKDTKMGYRYWVIYQFKSGTSVQREALMKEWIALMKEKDVVRQLAFYTAVIGQNNDIIVMTMDAKDETTFAQQEAEFWEKVGEEGYALWQKTEAILVKTETREGQFRPDLSMMPIPAEAPVTAEKK